MTVLLFGMLVGAAMVAMVATAGTRPFAVLTAGLVLLLLAAAAIATMPVEQSLRLALPLLGDPASPASAVLALLGAVAAVGGGALGWSLRSVVPSPPPPALVPGMAPPDPFAAEKRAQIRARIQLEAGLVAGCLVLALIGGVLSQFSLPRALLIGLFAGIAIITSLELRDALRDGRIPEFRSSWGGLGGGMGGWELSRPAVLLLLLLIFSAAALVAAVGLPAAVTDKTGTVKPGTDKPDEPAGKIPPKAGEKKPTDVE